MKSSIFLILKPEEILSKELPSRHIHHFRNVLRKIGVLEAIISDGLTNIYEAQILENNDIQIVDKKEIVTTTKEIIIIQAVVKQKRLYYLVEKLSELAVTNIVFFKSDRSQLNNINEDKLYYTAEKSCMQSHNYVVPRISWFAKGLTSLRFDTEKDYYWGDINGSHSPMISNSSSLCFINGPEGGWSDSEKEFLKNRFHSIVLSDTVLRAETAAISFSAIARYNYLRS